MHVLGELNSNKQTSEEVQSHVSNETVQRTFNFIGRKIQHEKLLHWWITKSNIFAAT